ncbi:uncharacterized protein LOC124170812 [Ischnura elegans]|uniref:uncharacterized protein LOC124170812 n=1 Tax=Ischnura elegans TaxID=197161 RepID=UPI001ED8710B|nr:uncharacterized protein LOC124170812 [Ischnura elegans]
MEVNRLTKDEVIYEIESRGGSADHDSGIDTLRTVLRELLRDVKQEELSRVSKKFDIESEFSIIGAKLDIVRKAIQDIKGGGDTASKRVKTLLFHLNNRFNNIFAMCQGEFKKKGKEICRDLKELSALFRSLGEGIEFQIPEILDLSSFSEVDNLCDNVIPGEGRDCSDQTRSYKGSQMHKWKVIFRGDGTESVNAFIIRVEELAMARGVSDYQLLLGAVELFEDKALHWFRSIRREVTSWKELKIMLRSEFLPLDFEENLLQEIKNRKQGTRESVGTFVACMLGLYERLGKEIGEEEKLSQIKRNLSPYYMERLSLQPILSIRQLKAIGKEVELYKSRIEQYEATRNIRMKSLEPDLAYKHTALSNIPSRPFVHSVHTEGTSMQCWNCNKLGHRFTECRLSPQLFCHRCGFKNKLTRDCPRCSRSGNKNNVRSGTSVPGN